MLRTTQGGRLILVVDDEQGIRQTLSAALGDEGYGVQTAASGKEGLALLRATRPDVVVLDIWMPEMDGLETLKIIREELPDQAVIMMSGHGNIETAVKSVKLGAFDFLEKPLSLEKLLVLIQNALQARDLLKENAVLRKQVSRHRQLIGASAAIHKIQDLVRRAAPTTGSVLITGENGTGKELVAHSIHALSTRSDKAFVEVNCAAIPEELIESELFGHEKGAFTGAVALKRGKFDLAHGGTLFLDEIGDMSLKTQAKILRILQEQKFERVGGTQTISVDVRIVAATNKDLKSEIQKGQFREDLFYRLNVIPFHILPLRERKEDVPLLVDHFVQEFSATHGKAVAPLSGDTVQALVEYPWPGNVRELKNLIERLVILGAPDDETGQIQLPPGLVLTHLGLDPEAQSKQQATNLREARQEFEKEFILKTLRSVDFNVSRAAQVLGIERSHLHRKIKSFGIETRGED